MSGLSRKGGGHGKSLCPESMAEKQVKIIGYIASAMSIVMYVSYIAQIYSNLHGMKGNFLQPLAAFFNCSVWSLYGFVKKPKEWPLIIANVPGVFLALTTVITSF